MKLKRGENKPKSVVLVVRRRRGRRGRRRRRRVMTTMPMTVVGPWALTNHGGGKSHPLV